MIKKFFQKNIKKKEKLIKQKIFISKTEFNKKFKIVDEKIKEFNSKKKRK